MASSVSPMPKSPASPSFSDSPKPPSSTPRPSSPPTAAHSCSTAAPTAPAPSSPPTTTAASTPSSPTAAAPSPTPGATPTPPLSAPPSPPSFPRHSSLSKPPLSPSIPPPVALDFYPQHLLFYGKSNKNFTILLSSSPLSVGRPAFDCNRAPVRDWSFSGADAKRVEGSLDWTGRGRQGRFGATERADGCRGCGDWIKPVRISQRNSPPRNIDFDINI